MTRRKRDMSEDEAQREEVAAAEEATREQEATGQREAEGQEEMPPVQGEVPAGEQPPDNAPQPVDQRPALGEGNYEVRLEAAPVLRVKARSPEEAWEVYKREMGINASDRPPQITEVTD
jgi:hypothetical protein